MYSTKINIEGLRKLSGNDEAFVNEILKLYVERAGEDMDEIVQARNIDDWDTVRFVVHRMRSAAVPLGLKDLVVLLKKVEMKLKEDPENDVENELDSILDITRAAREEARQFVTIVST